MGESTARKVTYSLPDDLLGEMETAVDRQRHSLDRRKPAHATRSTNCPAYLTRTTISSTSGLIMYCP